MFAWIIISPQLRWNIRKRKRPLGAGYLVVIKFHRVQRPAAVLVVLGIGTEYAGQQHAGPRAERDEPAVNFVSRWQSWSDLFAK